MTIYAFLFAWSLSVTARKTKQYAKISNKLNEKTEYAIDNADTKKINERKVYLDIFRGLACITVIIIHVTSFSNADEPFNRQIIDVFHNIMCSAVPIFIMISSACLLNSNKDFLVKKMFTKYIMRIIDALCTFGLLI